MVAANKMVGTKVIGVGACNPSAHNKRIEKGLEFDGHFSPGTVSLRTLSAALTLVTTDKFVQHIDPGGAARNVTLPAIASSNGLSYLIINAADAAEALTIRNPTPTTIGVIGQNQAGLVSCDGTTWRFVLFLGGTTALSASVANLNTLAGTVPQGLPLNEAKKFDAWKDDLADAAAAGSLGLADTPGSVLKNTASNNNTQDDACVFLYTLPPSYVAGSTVTVRIRAKKDTTAGTVSDTVDLQAKLVGDTLGSDICTTAAQAVTTSYANKDFTVTPTGLVAGDVLALEVHGLSNDTGGATNKQVFIARVEVRLG